MLPEENRKKQMTKWVDSGKEVYQLMENLAGIYESYIKT
jgi:hypothetical protein